MFSKVVIALCIIGAATAQENFKDCLQKDSISCVQLSVRKIGLNWVQDKMQARQWIGNRECLPVNLEIIPEC